MRDTIETKGSLFEARAALRKEKIAARDGIPAQERKIRSETICEKLCALEAFRRARTVLLYSAVRGEVSLAALEEMNRSAPEHEKKRFAYPLCIGEKMIAVLPGDSDRKSPAWRRGAFGIPEPDPEKGEIIEPSALDLVVCPCTSFDETGARLGMGGGYYDRYLPLCTNARILAVAFEVQKSDVIPAEPWDVPLQMIQTEKALYRPSAAGPSEHEAPGTVEKTDVPKKIAIVCDVLGEENNGTTVAAMNLIRYLKSRGHDVRVVCPDEYRRGEPGFFVVPQLNVGPLNEYVRKVGVSIAVSDDTVLSSALRDADAIHIMTPFFLGKAALDYGRKHGIPVTAGFHCQAENITSHLRLMNSTLVNMLTYKAMYRLVYQYVDAIHYPTQFIRDVFEAEVGKTNGYVISNGVNSRFKKMPAQRPEEWEGRFVILFTGRFGKEKSHKVLINAAALSRHERRIQLVFAGEGPLREEIEKAGEKLTNAPYLRFFSRDEMLRVINCADLYVHPAEIEIEAIACLEAISCGLVPVIADSPRSATKYFALGEKNLFRYNDPAELSEKIDYWIEHPQEKAQCSLEYQGYTQRFEQQHCMEEMEKMILETIEKHAEEKQS